ncbi:MAG: hypothetical protein JWP87_2925 [Labilithrix sp.]|nr:hypothetical protein [Labilithrix sp.]
MSFRFTALALVAALAGACSSTTTSPTSGAPAPSTTASTDPVDDAPPGDTKLTAYTEAEVQKLFDARCVKCHDATSPNVDLSTPFTEATVNAKTGGATGKTICGRSSDYVVRIKPGDREASLLWHKVKGTQDCGSPMPYDKGNKPLDATELERLGLYIDALAP